MAETRPTGDPMMPLSRSSTGLDERLHPKRVVTVSALNDAETEVEVSSPPTPPQRSSTRKTVISIAVLLAGSVVLLAHALASAVSICNRLLPSQTVSYPLHLQYGSGPSPYAVVALDEPQLEPQRAYNILVRLSIPSSVRDTHRDNFMIDVRLFGNAQASSPASETSSSELVPLMHSRRPSLLSYHSGLVMYLKRMLFLPYHVLSSRPESFTLTVPVSTSFQFTRAAQMPRTAHVELVGGQDIRTYHAYIEFVTERQLVRRALSWLHVPAIVFLATLLWIIELVFAGAVWFVLGKFFFGDGRSSEAEPRSIGQQRARRHSPI